MKKKGFTFIELIIVTALFSILTLSVLWLFIIGMRAWGSGRDRAQLIQSSGLAMERMVREIEQASAISRAQSGNIQFDADLNGDGSQERIRFNVSIDNILERTENNMAVGLAPFVAAFTLGYYLKGDNTNLLSSVTGPVLDDIRVVVITLTLNKGDETYTISSSAFARNRGM